MPNTFRQQIAADATAVFLATDTTTLAGQQSLAETVKHWPGGESDNEEEISVILVEDDLEGTNQVDGDGRSFHNDHGLRLRESVEMHMDDGVNVHAPDGKRGASIFWVTEADGDRVAYTAKRLISRDVGLQRWICVRVKKKVTRGQRERG